MKKKLSFSWSKINDYLTCPFMFKCKYIDKRKLEVNPMMIVGRVTHNALNIYNSHCLDKGLEHDFEKWEECAYMALEQENLPPENYQEVFDMVKQYAQSHTISLECTVGAEEEIAIDKDGKQVEWLDPSVWFRGAIDYLQIQGDFAKITDYKAGWVLSAPKMQLEIYAWLVFKIYPHVSSFEVEIDFVRHEYQVSFRIEAEDIPAIEKKILTKIHKIESDTKFDPTVNTACTYCGCWHWCPAMKKEDMGLHMPEAESEAVELALKLEKHEKMASEAKKLLRMYCDNKGSLIAGGKVFGFSVSNSWEFDAVEDLITKADEEGFDIFDALTVDNRKFKKYLNNPALRKVAQEIGKKKVTVSFGSKKHKKEDDLAPRDKYEKRD